MAFFQKVEILKKKKSTYLPTSFSGYLPDIRRFETKS
jgi:hypothetical protein